MDGAYLAGAAIVGEGLTRLVLDKFGVGNWVAKIGLGASAQRGLGMILVGLAAEPVLGMVGVKPRFRGLVSTANIAFGILKATEEYQNSLWHATGLGYYGSGPAWGVLGVGDYEGAGGGGWELGPGYGTPAPYVLGDYETVNGLGWDDYSGDPSAALQ